MTTKSDFKPGTDFLSTLNKGYTLLPSRFIRLDDNRYVVTNLVGEYVVLSRLELEQYVNHQIEPASLLYCDLKSKHFLFDEDSNVAIDLLALKYRSKAWRLSDFTGLHLFVVTLRCDHSCPYCQVSRQSEDKDAFDMTKETADAGLDFVFRSPSPEIKIEFQGGESLLNFNLIKYIVQEAERRNEKEGRKLDFVIATNLALLTEEILDFATQHEIYFSTSLDGPHWLHNTNRPRPGKDSYEKALEGIEKIRSRLGPDRVSALMTTTKESLPHVKDIIDEYAQLGFDGIFLRPLSPYGFAMRTQWYQAYDVSDWLDFYFRGLDYIIELNKNGHEFTEYYAAIILNKMFSATGTGYVDLQSPAGIGIAGIVFNYDGYVYASDEARMLAEMGDTTFQLGKLGRDSYEAIMTSDALLDTLESTMTECMPSCSDCGFQPFCGSDPLYHYATQRDPVGHKALSGFCKKNMAIFRRLITLMEDDLDARTVLLSWARP